MRYILMVTLAMIVALTAMFYYVSFTPVLARNMIPGFVEKNFKGVTLNALKIGGQNFAYPDILKLYDIDASINWNHETHEIKISELDMLNLQAFLMNKKQAIVQLRSLEWRTSDMQVNNAAMKVTVQFDVNGFLNCAIDLQGADIKYGNYDMSKLKAQISFNREALKITDFQALAYKGQAWGKMEMVFSPHAEDKVAIEFSGLDSQALGAVNKRIFSQMTGAFDGKFRMTRIDRMVQVLSLFVEMPRGGTIGPDLGKRIIGTMTNEDSRDTVSLRIEKTNQLTFEEANFRILNVNPTLAAVTIAITGKSEKFRIFETVNVNLDQMLKRLGLKI